MPSLVFVSGAPSGLRWVLTFSSSLVSGPVAKTAEWAVMDGGTWWKPDSLFITGGGTLRLTYLVDHSTATHVRYTGPGGEWLATNGATVQPFVAEL